jgi:integrator complex subunit 9
VFKHEKTDKKFPSATNSHSLKAGGNVLVPCYPSGVIYDLFECVSGHLDNSGLSSIPLYFISPVADSSLAYSNIFAEWLSHGKQSKVYVPEEPFPHANLVRENRLKSFRSVTQCC